MFSRRDFLYLGGLATSGWLLMPGRAAACAVSPAPAIGLFFDAADVPAMQRRYADRMFAGLRARLEAIDRAALRHFLASEVRYNDHLHHIVRVSDAAQKMAFHYVLTGDEDAAELSIRAVRTLMQFHRWDYFLEAGRHTIGLQRAPAAAIAVTLAADWLGDFVAHEERDAWLRAVGERGLEPSYAALYGMRYPERVAGWTIDESSTYFEHRPGDRLDLSNWPRILDATNLKAIPAAALAIGTAAYRHRFGPDDDGDRWLAQALFSLGTFRTLFEPDGSYSEGVSYADYTALHIAQATHALERTLGIDLFDLINWPGYAVYLREMSLPTEAEPSGIVNFGDNGQGVPSAVSFWVAARARDRRAQWTGLHLGRLHDEWSMIWYEPDLAPEEPPAQPHLWKSDLDWVVGRTGYTPDDLVVAMRSGGPANHEHADRNSILVKAFGEPLVTDPKRPPYSFSDPGWMMRTTAGHSALLIDGQNHQYHDGSEGTNPSDARARVVRTMERKGYLAWSSDATEAYALVLPDVTSVTRTVIVLHELPAVLVFDNVLKSREPSILQARFFGYNNDGLGRIEAEGHTFRTHRPGATLYAAAFAAGGVHTRTGRLPIPEETAARHPYAEAATRTADLAPSLLTVLLPERGAGGQASADATWAGGVFDVSIHHGTRTTRLHLFDTGTVPEFELAG